MTTLRMYGTAPESIVDGPGLRFSVFVQGCTHHCLGCHNPESQPSDGGYLCEPADIVHEIHKNKLIHGVTLTGGEPFEQVEGVFELAQLLKAEGYEISKSAIGRYAIRTTQAAQRVAQTIQRTQAIAQAVEAHPDLDYTKAASMVLMDGLMQRVSTAEDDFQEMPLDKAGRLIASLARNATYEKRVRQDMKKKAELAFEQMETELMAAIKQHPELAGELHDVLERAREKVLADGED